MRLKQINKSTQSKIIKKAEKVTKNRMRKKGKNTKRMM